MSSLLEEAIVDAKALKEAALKNAETAVLEKYSVEVKGALSTLLEQDELGLGLEESEEDGADATFTEDVPYAFQNEELEGAATEELIEIDFDALKERIDAEGSELTPADLIPATEAAMDLAEVAVSVNPDDDAATVEDPNEPGPIDAADLRGDAKTELEEDEEIHLTEEMLSSLVEELVVDMVARPQGWSAEGSAYNSVVQANDEAMEEAAAAHLDEEEIEETVHTAPDVVSDAGLYESKISDLNESTRELRALLIESKDQLTRLNLENAKLVYQNKALSSASLNERQKINIVEAVQSANSVEEANIIFETIQNAVGSTPDQRTRPQTLREAVTRPTSLLLNSKKNNEATVDPKMDRMLHLAGLTKQ